MTWLPAIALACLMMAIGSDGDLNGVIGDRDTQIDWGHNWVFVSLSSCNPAGACDALVYRSASPLVLRHVWYTTDPVEPGTKSDEVPPAIAP